MFNLSMFYHNTRTCTRMCLPTSSQSCPISTRLDNYWITLRTSHLTSYTT